MSTNERVHAKKRRRENKRERKREREREREREIMCEKKKKSNRENIN